MGYSLLLAVKERRVRALIRIVFVMNDFLI